MFICNKKKKKNKKKTFVNMEEENVHIFWMT